VNYAINLATHPGKLESMINSLVLGEVPVVIEATGACGPLESAFKLVGNEAGSCCSPPSIQHRDNGSLFLNCGEIMLNLFDKGATLIGGYVYSNPFSLERNYLGFRDIEVSEWPPKIGIKGTRYYSPDIWTSDEDIRMILNLIKYSALNIKPLITHRFQYRTDFRSL
jgi:hypothetical protein